MAEERENRYAHIVSATPDDDDDNDDSIAQ